MRAVSVGGKLESIKKKKSLCTLCILARKEGGIRFSGVHGANRGLTLWQLLGPKPCSSVDSWQTSAVSDKDSVQASPGGVGLQRAEGEPGKGVPSSFSPPSTRCRPGVRLPQHGCGAQSPETQAQRRAEGFSRLFLP